MVYKFRIRFEIAGGHIHCRLFCAPATIHDPTWASCGKFVVRKGAEFRDLVAAFKADFISESETHGIVEACAP